MTTNKRKNARLMYGSLLRCLTEAMVDNDQALARTARHLISQLFADTTLGHEVQLHEAVSKPLGCSREVAETVINDVQESCVAVDQATLTEDLTKAHRLIVAKLGADYMDRYPAKDGHVAKVVQSLIESIRRGKNITESSQRARVREAIVKHLMSKPVADDPVRPDKNRGELALKLATEGFNKEFSAQLSPEQMELLDAYVVGSIREDYTRLDRLITIRIPEIIDQLREFTDKGGAGEDEVLAERVRIVSEFVSRLPKDRRSLKDVLEAQSIITEVRR